MTARDQILDLRQRIGRSIIGQEEVVDRLVVGLLANGNLLLEGLPGLAKTRAVKSLAKNLDAGMSRIQFTPDLLPSDVTGTEVYENETGSFRFQPGPIFNNIILADEINRAPAKVQAALLEAMEERQVTVAGTTHTMDPLFMVMATQNPIEQEGTYPLPEAQLDRFLMHVYIDYPDEASELEVVRLVRGEEKANDSGGERAATIPRDAVFAARKEIQDTVSIAENVEKYIVDLVFATRYPERYGDNLEKMIELGASPRGSLGLDKCARVRAWLEGRDYVTPDDVRDAAYPVLRHRIALSYEANAEGKTTNDAISEVLNVVAVA
ncbi:MAG: AAA family ATPase [Myxococcota bacterium]